MRTFTKIIFSIFNILDLLYMINCIDASNENNITHSIINNADEQSVSFRPNQCLESDDESICILKPTCCYVKNFYFSYTYSACIDAKNEGNFQSLCQNFYQSNKNENFYFGECTCYGNYTYQTSSFLKMEIFNYYILGIIILIGLYS